MCIEHVFSQTHTQLTPLLRFTSHCIQDLFTVQNLRPFFILLFFLSSLQFLYFSIVLVVGKNENIKKMNKCMFYIRRGIMTFVAA